MGNCTAAQKSPGKMRKGQSKFVENFRSNIVPEFNKEISNDFRVLKEVGKGKMGSVYTAENIYHHLEKSPSRGRKYAIKEAIASKKSKHFIECLRTEIDALKVLDHPNVIKPHAVYFTEKNLHLVLHCCTGGNLYSGFGVDPSTGEKIPFTENKTATIIYQLLSAIAHMHARGVCHRDIKFENILFESNHPESQIKLIDFGIAQNIKVMYECCGTTYTMAREVLRMKGYSNKVDIWSVGVIVYMMLSLTKPFYGKNKFIITNKIMKGDFRYYSPRWESVSSEAKSFIEGLLEKNPDKRPSAVQSMNDFIWLKKYVLEYQSQLPTEEIMAKICNSMKKHISASIFKRIALVIIAFHLSTEETLGLRIGFDLFDRRRLGKINYADFAHVMKQRNESCTSEDTKKWFKSVNIHGDGHISYTEFIAACLTSHGYLTDETIQFSFRRLDIDRTGGISRSNLKEILHSDYDVWNIEKLWRENCFGDTINLDFFKAICIDDDYSEC